MKMIRQSTALMATAARIGFSDLAAIYTLRGWILGWFVRLVTQVMFFSLFGLLLGSAALANYRVIGNSAVLVCLESMAVVITIARERGEGTLAMQVLAPSSFSITYLARGAYTFIVGTASSTAAFVIGVFAFSVPVAMPQALLTPLFLLVMAMTSYCMGLALGVVAMARPSLQWLAINIGYLSVMTVAGVNVPVSYWPKSVQVIAAILPLTHGLQAFRLLLSGGSYAVIGQDLAGEVIVGACWLTVGLFLLTLAVRKGRVNGTLELASR